MEVAIIISALAALVLSFFIGKEFERIAKMKGHNEKRYFWWSFLLGPVGYLMVVALPDGAEKADTLASLNDELPEI